jgi:DNA anti-recombination protein RmuC
MKPLGELRNKLAEKKAKGEEWTDEDEAQLNGLDKQMAELANTYNEVTTKANAELNEYKEKVIAETE